MRYYKIIRGHPNGPVILPKFFSCSSLSSTLFASLCNNVCKFVQLSLAGPSLVQLMVFFSSGSRCWFF